MDWLNLLVYLCGASLVSGDVCCELLWVWGEGEGKGLMSQYLLCVLVLVVCVCVLACVFCFGVCVVLPWFHEICVVTCLCVLLLCLCGGFHETTVVTT